MSSTTSDRVLRPRSTRVNYNLSSNLQSSSAINETDQSGGRGIQPQSSSPATDSYRTQPSNCRSIFKWSRRNHNHRMKFHSFRLQRMSLYCAICVTLLYPKEAKTRSCQTPIHLLPCNEWGKAPIVVENGTSEYIC